MPTKGVPKSPRDFGAVRRFGLAHMIGAVVVIGAAGLAITFELIRDRNASVATAQAWDIKGPPCPQVSAADWTAHGLKAPKVFDYDGTKLGRWSGDASCSDVKDKGGAGFRTDKICQFTNPTVLSVTTPAGVTYFQPGVGQPATLSIHRDIPRCVLASKFTRDSE
jgi:hypothetical protein